MGSVLLEPDAVALGVPLADFGFVHGRQPVAGDMLERARARLSGACQGLGFGAASACRLFGLAGVAGVDACSERLGGFIATGTGGLPCHVGIGAEAQHSPLSRRSSSAAATSRRRSGAS